MSTLIVNARIVNEGTIEEKDVLINGSYIERIDRDLQSVSVKKVLDANGKFLLPGAIDDQVHFREPGMTHKATIATESRAAVAGGVTSFMEMPNTIPPAFTQKLLEEKYAIGAAHSLANYSFYIGASNDNLEEVLKTDPRRVCGLKIFMGSSTGNLLVNDPSVLAGFFSRVPFIIATHCEDEPTIRANMELYRKQYGEDIPARFHPLIRSAEGCYKCSSMAVALAKEHGTRLHILHISTARETALFEKDLPLESKRITAEACIHHLWFSDADYDRLGMRIKWNPAIKTADDRNAIFQALLDDRIDVIATDHAPHTIEEKSQTYFKAPSGGPLVQHSVVAMMELYHQGKISLEKIVLKMAHNPAILYQVEKRGFIREGYFADIAIVDPDAPWSVSHENILAKCGWSPFEGVRFRSRVADTFVSGHWAWHEGKLNENQMGQRLSFTR